MKFDMIDKLRTLLLDGTAGTQEELCNALESMGYEVNQSKVSRLLRKIGAVKAKNESGQLVYRLSKEPAPPIPSNRLSSLLMNIVANETSIIITTSPGSASMIARILDYKKQQCSIIGTIAGDDTILIIPLSIKKIDQTFNAVKSVLHLQS